MLTFSISLLEKGFGSNLDKIGTFPIFSYFHQAKAEWQENREKALAECLENTQDLPSEEILLGYRLRSPPPSGEEPCPLSLAHGFYNTQPSPGVLETVAGEIPRVFKPLSLSLSIRVESIIPSAELSF